VAQETIDSVGALAERYLHAVAGQDWSTVSACIASNVVRHGPFGDDVEGADEYVSFLKRTMPSLPGYRMDIDRVNELGDHRAMVELRETIVVESGPLETFECLVFDVNSEGLLANISIYIRQTAR
jgi:SnoaL-like domain